MQREHSFQQVSKSRLDFLVVVIRERSVGYSHPHLHSCLDQQSLAAYDGLRLVLFSLSPLRTPLLIIIH